MTDETYFTKLFASITESSVWGEPAGTRLTWITLLAKCDQKGRVFAAVPGLARMANVSLEECEAALKCFLSPDRYSRTKEHDGRRIEEIQGGWRLLNYEAKRNGHAALSADEDAGKAYFIQCGGSVKIGFSKNPWARVAALKDHHPSAPELLGHFVATEDEVAAIQHLFKRYAIGKGWFSANKELSEYIATKAATTELPVAEGSKVVQLQQEREREVDVKKQRGQAELLPAGTKASGIPYREILDLYNSTMVRLPRALELNPKRKTLITAAWTHNLQRRSLKFWKAYFEECQDSNFLNGTGPYRGEHSNWKPTFDFLMRADQITKIYEAAMHRVGQ